MIEPEKVGEEAMALMDQLNLTELPEGAYIDEVLVIAAVVFPTNDPDVSGSNTFYRCTSALPWIQKGLLVHAMRMIEMSGRPFEG
jgi:hypothetical protein